MLGLMFLLVIGGLVLLVWAVMYFTQRGALAAGKPPNVARRWKYGVLAAVLLLIFWDWLPTWIAYEHYSRQAGLRVFKTLEQWNAENPGVAETLEPYRRFVASDPRWRSFDLPTGGSRSPLNERFAYDRNEDTPFLSVVRVHHRLVDTKTGQTLVQLTAVTSGNAGGVASGGPGWWKPWLIRKQAVLSEQEQEQFFRFVDKAHQIAKGE